VCFLNDDGVEMACRIAEGTFPDMSAFLTAGGDEIVFPDDLSDIVIRSAVFMNDEESNCQISLSKDSITVSGKGAYGWFEEETKAEYSGNAVTFLINPQYLINILKKKCTIKLLDNMLKFIAEYFVHCCAIQKDKE
jgi:DNA polymerase III sliding clamp (beta) subunit (PCNA family)